MGNTYHPFNIQNIGGNLYVQYAKVGADGRDEAGPGNGFVRRFNTNGIRDLTFGIDHGQLNSPWGAVIAPASFGVFGGALLIGNFGEGSPSINAFNPMTGASIGSLTDDSGTNLVIDQLWALVFGNGGNGGDPNTLYFTAGTAEEEHGLFGSIKPVSAPATSTIQFSTDEYTINEASGSVNVTVTRNGDLTGTATVRIASFDESSPGHASQKSDYQIVVGTLEFKPGESSKTFTVLLVNDLFVESVEQIDLMLSNVTGTLTGLGSPSHAVIKIIDDDTSPPTTNPIDDTNTFVRQQYLDFLAREADPPGLTYWASQISFCGSNAACLLNRRNAVSFAFFVETEFQRTSLFTILGTRAAYGRDPLYGEYNVDKNKIGQGTDGERTSFVNDFVTHNEFKATLDSLTNAQYVDRLLANAGLGTTKLFVANLTGAQEVPPTPSTGTGRSSVVLNATETGATVNLSFSGLTSAQTGAHIHGPADPGVNAPIIFPLPNGQVTNFAITPTAAQVADLKAGKQYVNVHTTNFLNGEIRGQYSLFRDRDDLVSKLDAGTLTRAQVLRIIAESDDFILQQTTRAFILAEYFGYLRRDPDVAGLNFWINNLNTTGTKQGMVCAFLTSAEYQLRFSVVATRTNADCAALVP
ncbi:MAG: TIGR03118 family protein [Acidobacteria bacterium]|nr:MAG: TIGR03118 family protein [Acidobacteriota bacterium]